MQLVYEARVHEALRQRGGSTHSRHCLEGEGERDRGREEERDRGREGVRERGSEGERESEGAGERERRREGARGSGRERKRERERERGRHAAPAIACSMRCTAQDCRGFARDIHPVRDFPLSRMRMH